MSYEPNETELIKRELKLGDTFFDVGAYEGYYTLLASDLVGEQGKVVAFEPTQESYKKLKESISTRYNMGDKYNIGTIDYAVSDQDGETELHHYKAPDTNRIIDVAPHLNIPISTSKVHKVSLDNYYQGKIDFIKADVEGSEYLVFKGAERHLKENPDIKLMFELPDFKLVELLIFLKDLGFKSYLIREKLEEFDIKDLETEKGELYDNIQQFKKLEGINNIFCKR